MNKGQKSSEDLKLQGLLDRFLKVRNNYTGQNTSENHLDEDSLTAFVEGRITEFEAPAIMRHIVDCSFCLHVTAELLKLQTAFETSETSASEVKSEPAKISEVLSGVLAKIFGTTEGAVFAHQEDKPEGNNHDSENTKEN